MSSQLEFIMQLYMMNLLQQQQQQQQQQQFLQNLSPTKSKDNNNINSAINAINYNNQNLTTTMTTPMKAQTTTKHQKQQQQQQHNQRTQKRQNSQNTNCSSSRSCSPNSNFSPIQNHNSLVQQQQQQQSSALLLNTLTPLTQLMLQQQQQRQQQQPQPQLTTPTAPSNLLLTPITPNSLDNKSAIFSDYLLGNSSNAGAFVPSGPHSSALPFSNFNFQHTTPNVANISFTAQNFLQSSTVTSTPTDEKTPKFAIEVDDDYANVGIGDGDGDGEDDDGGVDDETSAAHLSDDDETEENRSSNIKMRNGEQQACSTDGQNREKATTETVGFDEDDIPLSILQTSSSGVVSSCTTSGESSTKLLHSTTGANILESSATTMEDTNTRDSAINMPYTPIKQEADSSLSSALTATQQMPLMCSKSAKTMQQTFLTAIKDDSNMTPLALAANAMLTPPSSEQLLVKNFDSPATTPSNLGSGKSTSSLDAFLPSGENLKNLKKFSSYLECENPLCRQENMREHFHCFDEPCKGKILGKKDDIIRHFKWHKKRIESLKLGFARFSKFDDCVPEYGENCAYHMKQTHYHCIYEGCKKNYVSTSDVQMHANFHRKDMEIVKEGFQRFRAHENCKTETCPYYDKGESHYHCCREGCNHTFKNKADMDKHKSQHMKAYQMKEDGFKKILKTELCPFGGCRHPNNEPSIAVTHIHCLRDGCNFICNPSSSQMISHKRKHEREDGEQAYQQFKKQKEQSEDESPSSEQQLKPSIAANAGSSHVSTPLSSHTSTEQFLSRKRGRPPKMIQLPADSTCDSKRFKLEPTNEQQQHQQQQQQTQAQYQQQQQQLLNLSNSLTAGPNMFSPFLPNLNAAASTASMQQNLQDSNVPSNFQMTHLMALFQLQNPLFYQNLYPGMLAAGVLPQNSSMFGNLAAINAAAAAAAIAAPHVKTEFSEKQQFKE